LSSYRRRISAGDPLF